MILFQHSLNPELVIAKVAEYFATSVETILRRKSQEKTARAVAIYLSSIYCNSRMTLTEIGEIFSLSLSGLTRTRDRVRDKLISGDKELTRDISKIKKINSGGVTLWISDTNEGVLYGLTHSYYDNTVYYFKETIRERFMKADNAGRYFPHELGHACHLPHYDTGHFLMNTMPAVRGGDSFSEYSIKQIRKMPKPHTNSGR